MSNAFTASNEMIMRFYFILFFTQFIYMVDYIYLLLYIEPFLHLHDVACLIMVDNLFDVFLDLVCKYFIEYFCIYVHKRN